MRVHVLSRFLDYQVSLAKHLLTHVRKPVLERMAQMSLLGSAATTSAIFGKEEPRQ